MDAIMLVIIVFLLCTSLYFAYRYFSLKRQADSQSEVTNGAEELSASQLKEQLHLYEKNINEKGQNLVEHGEYAAEKADIVRAAIDEVGKGLKNN